MLNTVHFREQSASYRGVSGTLFILRSVYQVHRAKEHFASARPEPFWRLRWSTGRSIWTRSILRTVHAAPVAIGGRASQALLGTAPGAHRFQTLNDGQCSESIGVPFHPAPDMSSRHATTIAAILGMSLIGNRCRFHIESASARPC